MNIFHNYMMNFLINLIVFFIIFIPNLKAETVTAKCYIDENHSYTFLFNIEKKSVSWLDQNNQDMKVTIFPNVEKGGYLLIMGGTGPKNEKHTFLACLRPQDVKNQIYREKIGLEDGFNVS